MSDDRDKPDGWDADRFGMRGRMGRAVPDLEVPHDAWQRVSARARSRQRRRGAAVAGAASVAASAVVAVLVGTGLPGLALSSTGVVGPAGYPSSTSTSTVRPSDPAFDYFRDGQSLAELLSAGPSPEQRGLLFEAENLLLRDCMRAGGSDWTWQPRAEAEAGWSQQDVVEQGRLRGDAAAFGDVETSQREGYGIDWTWQEYSPTGGGDGNEYGFPAGDDPEAASRLLLGNALEDGIDLETLNGPLTIPATGCDAEVRQELYGDYVQWMRSTDAVATLVQPDTAYMLLRDQDPGLAAADVAWAGCMDDKGFPGLRVQRDASALVWTKFQGTGDPGAEAFERQVAVADAECVVETGYEAELGPAEAKLVTYLSRDGDLRAYGALVEQALPRAEAVLADNAATGGTPAAGDVDSLQGVDLSAASEAQAAEVSDRVVTAEEYRAAFERYRDCMSDAGFELQDPLMIDGVYSSPITQEAKESGVFDECYDREYRYTDAVWQVSPAVLDQSNTTDLLRDCLRERGVEPSDTRAGVDEQIRQEGIAVEDCLP